MYQRHQATLPPNKPLMMKGEVSTIALFSIYGKRFVSVLVEPAFDYSMQTSTFWHAPAESVWEIRKGKEFKITWDVLNTREFIKSSFCFVFHGLENLKVYLSRMKIILLSFKWKLRLVIWPSGWGHLFNLRFFSQNRAMEDSSSYVCLLTSRYIPWQTCTFSYTYKCIQNVK